MKYERPEWLSIGRLEAHTLGNGGKKQDATPNYREDHDEKDIHSSFRRAREAAAASQRV